MARFVLITWCSTGIGRATAKALYRKWYVVFAWVRRKKDSDSIQDECPWIYTTMLDITSADDLQKSYDYIADVTGGRWIDVLINNAGIAVAWSFEEISLDDYRRQMEVNLFGTIATIKQFLPSLKKNKWQIFVISSVVWVLSMPYLSPYGVSKHWLEALCDSLRIELDDFWVSVSVVQVGRVKTPLWNNSLDSSMQNFAWLKQHNKKRYEDIVKLVRGANKKWISADRVAYSICRHVGRWHRTAARILVGWDIQKTTWVKRLLPTKWRDVIVMRSLSMWL